jgi:hypothetical protein
MASDINDVTVNYEEDGVLKVKELDKEILTKGAWATIVFKYKNYDWKKEDYGDTKYIIRRYRKVEGEYKPQSKFNISSNKQAKLVVEVLQKWLDKEEKTE